MQQLYCSNNMVELYSYYDYLSHLTTRWHCSRALAFVTGPKFVAKHTEPIFDRVPLKYMGDSDQLRNQKYHVRLFKIRLWNNCGVTIPLLALNVNRTRCTFARGLAMKGSWLWKSNTLSFLLCTILWMWVANFGNGYVIVGGVPGLLKKKKNSKDTNYYNASS